MTRELLVPGQIQVIDGLDNSTYIIGQDGIIRFAENWTNSENIEAALIELLKGDTNPN